VVSVVEYSSSEPGAFETVLVGIFEDDPVSVESTGTTNEPAHTSSRERHPQ
jgi:hypothetical protein